MHNENILRLISKFDIAILNSFTNSHQMAINLRLIKLLRAFQSIKCTTFSESGKGEILKKKYEFYSLNNQKHGFRQPDQNLYL